MKDEPKQPESVADFKHRLAVAMREREEGKIYSVIGARRAADCVTRKAADNTQAKMKTKNNNQPIDAKRQFDSVEEAIDYVNQQASPMTAFKAVILANIEMGEFGFAAQLTMEGDSVEGDWNDPRDLKANTQHAGSA